MLGLVSVIGMPFTVLLPIVADKVLGGGPHTLGFLTAAHRRRRADLRHGSGDAPQRAWDWANGWGSPRRFWAYR